MVAADATILTDRQVAVLEYREQGLTQQEIAEKFDTTDSNVSAIERAAERNVEKARQTLELARTIRSPVQFSVPSGTSVDELVTDVYAHGDEAGIKIAECRPALYTHLYESLRQDIDRNALTVPLEVGITANGEVRVFSGEE